MPKTGYKECNKCGESKPLCEFYPHKRLKDGLTNECKVCVREHASRWQRENRERANTRKLRWAEEHRQRSRETKTAWSERNREQVRANARQMRELYPEKYRARAILGSAVRSGKIIKPDHCSECGEEFPSRRIHGHHSDYSKPLEVNWLCTGCHGVEHRGT